MLCNKCGQRLIAYIDAHLIPEDPILLQTLENTEKHGFPDHLAVAPNQGMLLQMLIQMNTVQTCT